MNKLKISKISYYKFDEDSKYFSSHWDITSRCNIRCSYCTYENRDEDYYPYDHMSKIIEFYDNLYKKYNLSLTLFGGEPLTHPHIKKIVHRLGRSIYPLKIFTNLTKSKEFFRELCSIRSDLKFLASFHHESANLDLFLEKIELIKSMGAEIHVKVMWDSTKKEEIKAIYDKFPHIKSLDMIYHPNQTFTEDDRNWYVEENIRNNLNLYNVDGEKLSYNEIKLRMNGNATFKGYNCDATKRHLMVCSNGDVHPCLTYRKMKHIPLFNIINDEFNIEQESIICTEPECYSEIGVPKQKRKIPKMVCMVLGEKCNWDCSYCDRPKIVNQNNVNFDILREYYPKIVKWIGDDCDIHISGGETGLVNEDVLDFLFSFDKKLIVETNGTFFKKYYDKYYDRIKEITYHCVPELDREIEYNIIDEKVKYLVVVHHKNIHLLEDFIRKNGNRNWILQYYYPKFIGGDHEKFKLTRSDYFTLIKNFSSLVDYRELSRRISEPNNIDELRVKCAEQFDFVGFDFVNGRIKFCKQSHSFTNSTELNEENFDLLLRDKLKNPKMDEICRTCTEVVRYF